jgi:hypothetical protein
MIRFLIKLKNFLEKYIRNHSKFMCDKCVNGKLWMIPKEPMYECNGVHAWNPGHKCPNFIEGSKDTISRVLD